MSNKIYHGVIVIFYKDFAGERKFLVVENSATGNISFVGGAQEGSETLVETARREIKEELGLEISENNLIRTEVKHEFVYGAQKKERAGAFCSNAVYLVDASHLPEINHTRELKKIEWLSAEDVLDKLTFLDLKEVFTKVITSLDKN